MSDYDFDVPDDTVGVMLFRRDPDNPSVIAAEFLESATDVPMLREEMVTILAQVAHSIQQELKEQEL